MRRSVRVRELPEVRQASRPGRLSRPLHRPNRARAFEELLPQGRRRAVPNHGRERRRGQGPALHRAAQDAGRPADDRPTPGRRRRAGHPHGPLGSVDAHVFTSDKGATLRTSNFRTKVWLPAVRAAGLAPLRPHDLRHTAVALWIAAGANPKEVSVRAGHTSVSFTLDRYGHLSRATTWSCATGWTPCWPRG
jgi:hypothetical protein